MVPLDEGNYARVRPVFEGLRYNLVVDSVIDGNTPGWVYVDDVRHPRTAWMWDMMDAMLVAGRADDDEVNRALARLIDERVLPKAVIPMLSLHYYPEEWEGRMGVVLHGKGARKAWRRFYTFGGLKAGWRRAMPATCQMRRIDEELLESTDLGNVQDVAGWVRSFWASYRGFVERGLGFCLVERAPETPPGRGLGAEGGTIASWCLSVFASGTQFELGLTTASDHRGRGYATLTAAACVEHCVEHGLTPHWHCWEDNAPSMRVAEKVGFERPERYTVYRFEW
jgi:RimJ/RimL family protein N-acetyltransferase